MNIPWPRHHRATLPTILALLLALVVAAPGTSRAAADSGDTGAIGDPAACPCTLWPSTIGPTFGPDPDTAATELGVKFQADRAGYILGVRFWKDVANTGTHTGTLWSEAGVQLATATFISESESGWQQVNFAQPVAVTAGTTYVASYHAPNGRYSNDQNGLTAARVRGPLTAPASEAVGGNGVYVYGSGFPNSTWNDSNYWVEPVFGTTDTRGPAPKVLDFFPKGDREVPVDTVFTITFDREVQPGTIHWGVYRGETDNYRGTTTYDPTTGVSTFVLDYALERAKSYTVDVVGVKTLDGALLSEVRWSVTTVGSESRL
ncbi:DUF4082 domain-containing protein [Embleya hyalina]|uniref:DUF4082 domain-containing protein n=1 Tax=Embleya hyalina TaxID=516124 RepID=A0A401YSS8_9ACTN|nr:DUF4082 domain-containing protein [Embleya hyalina]GCD97663.1 hypothetical protein EHYA_05359 [Embleya hyalina]